MPVFEKDRETANYWDSLVTSGRLKRANIDFFFSAYLYIKIQDPDIKVSADHKMRYRRSEGLFNNYKDFISNYKLNKTDMLYDIMDYAMLYQDNINPGIAEGEIPGTPGIERMNFLIFVLDYTTLVPYTLYLLKNVSDKTERNAMFGYIESYVMRRQICKSDNKNFSDLFAENLINNQVLTLEELKDYIENKDESQALALPRDRKLSSAFHTSQLPNKKSLAILYLMETALRAGKPHATKLDTFDKYSLEHLMPKQWEKNWPLAPDGDVNQRNSMLLTLGNMSMLPAKLNTQISNSGWADKKKGKGNNRGLEYYAAGIVTLEHVLDRPVWNEEAISERADWLAAKAIEIWPSYLPEDYDEENGENEANGAGSSPAVNSAADTHDYTKFSLNGGAFVPKSRFVLDVVRAYMAKHPDATYSQLKKVFHDGLCSSGFKFKGFLCTEEDYNAWESKYKTKRYMPDGPDRRLTSSDGVVFFVNTQWTLEGTKGVAKLASVRHLLHVVQDGGILDAGGLRGHVQVQGGPGSHQRLVPAQPLVLATPLDAESQQADAQTAEQHQRIHVPNQIPGARAVGQVFDQGLHGGKAEHTCEDAAQDAHGLAGAAAVGPLFLLCLCRRDKAALGGPLAACGLPVRGTVVGGRLAPALMGAAGGIGGGGLGTLAEFLPQGLLFLLAHGGGRVRPVDMVFQVRLFLR